MKEEKTLENEKLTEEELSIVAGGNQAEDKLDMIFFQQLGYDMTKISVSDAWRANGVKYSDGGIFNQKNDYAFMESDGWQKYPHWAAMGRVLAQRNYPGFEGNRWGDGNYVGSFLREHFHINP